MTRTSKSAAEILQNYRISTATSAPGRYYAICPQCSHTRRKKLEKCLGVTVDEKGVAWGCNHCSWTGGDLYSRDTVPRASKPPATQTRRAAPHLKENVVNRTAAPLALWKESGEPRGTVVETYLKRRGLELFDDVAGRVVRFHAACPFGPGQRHPAIITAFRSIATDEVQAVHRTALNPDGSKIGRMMLGPVAGAAIKIDGDQDVEQGLTVGEGFETCLAGRMMGFRPSWSLGSANAIASFPLLAGIDALTILGETDDSGANAKAVRACGNRWAAAGREVIVATPRQGGDMNNAVQA